jgi:hypothetical protein
MRHLQCNVIKCTDTRMLLLAYHCAKGATPTVCYYLITLLAMHALTYLFMRCAAVLLLCLAGVHQQVQVQC